MEPRRDMAGVGHHGVDLAAMRMDAALMYGPAAAGLVLDGSLHGSGHPPHALSYWDAVAALNTPTDMAQYVPVIHDQGRNDLDAATAERAPRPPALRTGCFMSRLTDSP
jgi:hypothetical protein